jgi:hypothetical protein
MRALLILLPLLAAGCAQGAEKDLPYVKQARSVAAEWAMVNEQAAKGKLTDDYVAGMRGAARQQLRTAASSLATPAYAQIVERLIAMPDDADPAQLRSSVDALKTIEDQLESD